MNIDFINAYKLIPNEFKGGDIRKSVTTYIKEHPEVIAKMPTIQVLSRLQNKISYGHLSKCWYRMYDGDYLAKGNSPGCYEPYSEVLASRIGKLLGFNVVEYTLGDKEYFREVDTYDCKHVSLCKKYDYPDATQCIPYGLLPELGGIALTAQEMIDTHKMLLLDAIVGNSERTMYDFDIAINGSEHSLAPILDFGASCLSMIPDSKLKLYKGIGPNDSKPFKKNHSAQLKMIGRRFKLDVDIKSVYNQWESNCEDVFQYLSDFRIECIKNYILHRMEAFIT